MVSPSVEDARDESATGARAPLAARSHDLVRHLVRLMLGIGAFIGVVAAAASFARGELESLGRTFVQHCGVAGMFLGTFLADAFSFFPYRPATDA